MELVTTSRRRVLLCNHNYSHEGIYHPDRILNEFDLLYMQQGEWKIIEDDKTYDIGPGDVLILEPHKHHYSMDRCSPEMKNAYIHFEELEGDSSFIEFMPKAGRTEEPFMEKDKGKSLPEAAPIHIDKVTACSEHAVIYHYIEQIIECFWATEMPNREFREEALLSVLLTELSALSREHLTGTDVVITEALHRIHCEPERFFSPEELATDYGLSVRAFSGRFKKVTGTSLHQYEISLKLSMAYDLLPMNPGRGLRDIARSFGFYDEYQFSKLFKRQYGISPSERRK